MARPRINPPDMETSEVARLWREYATTRNTALRDRLVSLYHPLAVRSALLIHGRLPSGVELDDLVSVGTMGLIRGIDKFDPFRGTKAVSYLITKIRGAIIDDLRKLDLLPRSRRNKVKRAEEARTALLMELERPATPEEVAERTGLALDAIAADDLDAVTRPVYSLNVELFDDSNDVVSESLHQVCEPDPAHEAAARERHPTLLNDLTEAERDVITMLFYEERSPAHVAATRGLSESRICQIRVAALDKIHGGRTYRQMKAMLVA